MVVCPSWEVFAHGRSELERRNIWRVPGVVVEKYDRPWTETPTDKHVRNGTFRLSGLQRVSGVLRLTRQGGVPAGRSRR